MVGRIRRLVRRRRQTLDQKLIEILNKEKKVHGGWQAGGHRPSGERTDHLP
jgi:hypothetical protein